MLVKNTDKESEHKFTAQRMDNQRKRSKSVNKNKRNKRMKYTQSSDARNHVKINIEY